MKSKRIYTVCLVFLIVMFFGITGCRHSSKDSAAKDSSSSVPPAAAKEYTVKFEGFPPALGSISAKTEAGKPIVSGAKVPENTVIIFTAEPKPAPAGKKYVATAWRGSKELKVAKDKKTARLTVKANVKIATTFLEQNNS